MRGAMESYQSVNAVVVYGDFKMAFNIQVVQHGVDKTGAVVEASAESNMAVGNSVEIFTPFEYE
jgi:hypothetical protein